MDYVKEQRESNEEFQNMKVAAQAMMLILIKDLVYKPTPQEEISKIYDRIGKLEEKFDTLFELLWKHLRKR